MMMMFDNEFREGITVCDEDDQWMHLFSQMACIYVLEAVHI
nr:hypothetical protein [Tanacetum cinerariifolium]